MRSTSEDRKKISNYSRISPNDAPRPRYELTHDVVTRWGGNKTLLRNGFVPVATAFLWHGAELGLTPVEILLIINLIAHKWSDEPPRPSYRKLAARVGISLVHCRRLIRVLERKGLLVRVPARGGNSSFDLTPLFARLAALMHERDLHARLERAESIDVARAGHPLVAASGSEVAAQRK